MRGLRNGRVSVRPSLCLSRRATSAACRSLGAGSRYRRLLPAPRTDSCRCSSCGCAGSVMLRAEVRGSTPTRLCSDSHTDSEMVYEWGPVTVEPHLTVPKYSLIKLETGSCLLQTPIGKSARLRCCIVVLFCTVGYCCTVPAYKPLLLYY